MERTRQAQKTEPVVRIALSFDAFYRAEYRAVLRLAFTLSGSWAAAEELAQAAFEAAWRRWEDVSDYERPDSWVRQVVVNKARSSLRRSYAETAARLRMGPRTHYELPQPTDEFWDHVRRLPRQQAAAIALFYLEDRTTEEIADMLGCAPATARVHLHKARDTLARLISTEETP